MAIFVVILTDYSNGFDSHLVQFHPLFGGVSISKMVPENFPVLEPLEKCLLMAVNSCQKNLEFLWSSSLITTILLGLPSYPQSPTIQSPCFIWKYRAFWSQFSFFCLPLCLPGKLSCHALLLRRVLWAIHIFLHSYQGSIHIFFVMRHNWLEWQRWKNKTFTTQQRHTRPQELLLWSYHLPLGSWQNSLVIKLVQSMLALILLSCPRTNLIFFDFKDWIIVAYCLTVGPMYSSQLPHLPLRTGCLLFRKSQFIVINPSLYLKDENLFLRSVNNGAAVDGSTPKNCLYIIIFQVRFTFPWHLVSNPA